MKRATVILLVAVTVLLSLPAFAEVFPFAAPEGESLVPGEILIRFEADLPSATINSIRRSTDARFVGTLYRSPVQKWRIPEGQEKAISAALTERQGVVWAEPNYRVYGFATVPDDPGLSSQWGHTRVGSAAAWDLTTGSSDITIAILDSGIDSGHPDLAAKIVAGYDFVEDDAVPNDERGHGTHVAGIAAAVTNNATGIAGMSWGARIMPVRVLDEDGSGYSDDVASGITWAYMNGADIINLSLGSSSFSQAVQDAVNAAHAAGVLVIAAMGNDDTSTPFYPAACANVFAVAATNNADGQASYSNYGAHCDIAAPGGQMTYYHDPGGIYSTMPTYSCTLTTNYSYSQNYDQLQGTSQASPMVAGLAALILSLNPDLSPDQVQSIIETTATDRGTPGWDQDYGWGLIDAAAALAAALDIFADGFESGFSSWSRTVE